MPLRLLFVSDTHVPNRARTLSSHALVGDLYEWAGEIRTADTQAMGTGVPY